MSYLHAPAMFATVRQIHRLIARERDLGRLLQGVAELLVDGRERHACALALTEGRRIVRAVEAGAAESRENLRALLAAGELPAVGVEWVGLGQGVTGLALPLTCEGRTYGALLGILPTPLAAEPAEVELLEDVATDLAFALRSLELEAGLREQTSLLAQSERKYRLVSDNVSDTVSVLDLDTNTFLHVSPSVERIRGFTAAEVIAAGPDGALTEASRTYVSRVTAKRLANPTDVNRTYYDILEQPHKDGSVVRVETSSRAFRDPITGHLLIYSVARDLGPAEQARALQEQFSVIADSVPGMIHSVQRWPDGRMSMPFASRAATDLLGLARETLAEGLEPFLAGVHPDDLPQIRGWLADAEASLTPWRGEFRYLHPRKGLRWMECSSTPVRAPDGSVVCHGMMDDVTERRLSSDRTERLSRLYRALSDTNAAIAHISDEDALLRRVCDIIMELGDVGGVGILAADLQQGALRWVASAGPLGAVSQGLMDIPLRLDTPPGVSMLVDAFREGRTLVDNAYAEAAESVRWEDPAVTPLVGAGVVLPLMRGGEPYGVLGLAAAPRHYFDNEVVELLETMGRNLSLGMESAARGRDLHSSEARFRAIFDLAPVGVAWVETTTGRFVRVNRRYGEILGYPVEELVGRSWQDVTHPDHLDENRTRATEIESGALTTYLTEKRYIRRDGSIVWVELAVKRVVEEATGACFHVTVVADITARKAAEAARRASEERYRMLVDNLGDVVFTADLDGTITFLSRAVERFGASAEGLVGRNMSDAIHAEDVHLVRERHLSAIRDRIAGTIEYRLYDASGKVRHVRSTSHPIIENGEVVGLAGVLVDLTQQRDTEEQLRFAQKMEAVGRLAGGVAHDFNNLLSVIQSYTDLLLESAAPGDPLHSDLMEIRAAGKRAETLTRQLLAFSRKQTLRPEVLDLNTLVERVEKMLGRLLGEDIEQVFVPGEMLARVEVDPGQIEQVLMNLAINARDAMPSGGQLRLMTANVTVGGRHVGLPPGLAPGRYVRLSVHDTGHGMDEATRLRIFEPFFTTKPAGKGTGLGLSMVYGIVQQSGGVIGVRSAVGEGTTFDIYLPSANERPMVPEDTPPPTKEVRGAETILVVEDEPAVRNLARRVLSSVGFHVLVAANAGEALILSEKHPGAIDLMLSDVVMPGINGPTLAKRLAPLRPQMKVLFMSGYPDEAFREFMGQAAFELIDKPFSTGALTQRVRAVLDRR